MSEDNPENSCMKNIKDTIIILAKAAARKVNYGQVEEAEMFADMFDRLGIPEKDRPKYIRRLAIEEMKERCRHKR